MKKSLFSIIVITLCSTTSMAQKFDLSAQIKPRYENLHGFGTLINENANGSNFVSQRTRLILNFEQKKSDWVSHSKMLGLGDVGTMSSDDNATAMHEAWAELVLSKKPPKAGPARNRI